MRMAPLLPSHHAHREILTYSQTAARTPTAVGRNVLLSSSVRCCLSGTLRHWMLLGKTEKLLLRLSTLRMHPLRWYGSRDPILLFWVLTERQIETLPTRNPDVQPLQNVLSISTAGKNRYLLHFNSLHSLTQWTAGIRLAMFEHASLQELYTGSLIAGKGKLLNNIRTIMERSKFKTEDWARVRFGAGTPWRRCWCVIEPPDEKEFQRTNKSLKKKSAYERPTLPKGEIKFYDTKKTKKATPIATITDAYAAYAIYPQAKPLIDQSTLVKVEGRITIHSKPESKTEGFVFVMPELHPAVSGFEMMLRWLFPVYDVFHLYGRPQRLIADTWDTRGLMFAMPKERRYGYLDIIDVAALIHTQGSDKWSEREWRKQMKEMTNKRIAMTAQSRSSSTLDGRRHGRTHSESRRGVHYDDNASIHSNPSSRHHLDQSSEVVYATPQKISAAPTNGGYLSAGQNQHARSVSESVAYMSPKKSRQQQDNRYSPRPSHEYAQPPAPVELPQAPPGMRDPYKNMAIPSELDASDSRYSSDSDGQGQGPRTYPEDVQNDVRQATPPGPVMAPPNFQHQGGDVPQKRPDARPDLRREKSRMSNATLSQIVDVNRLAGSGAAGHAAAVAWNNGRPAQGEEDQGPRGVNHPPHDLIEIHANQPSSQAVVEEVAAGTATAVAGTQNLADVRPEYARLLSEQSAPQTHIPRKPVPIRTSTLPAPLQSQSHPSSTDAMPQHSTSHYDRESTGTPDYDSLPEDSDHLVPRRKTRTGVLKTVGDPTLGNNGAVHHSSPVQVDIPLVDFGTTFTPSLTPGHSRPATSSGLAGRQSPFGQPLTAPTTPSTKSPQDERNSFGRHTPSDERRSSSGESMSPRPNRSRAPSYAWHPGLAAGRQSPGAGLTAAEFVQLRAAAARMPIGHAPRRSVSYSKVEQSPEQMLRKRDSVVRPSSRNSLLVDYSSHLSAREQEHVAKMTGGPLIKLNETKPAPDPSVGLIGAIEAREQEKRNMKDGLAGHMVQEAIAQRQAAERNYGMSQYQGFTSSIDARQNGQWINPRSSMYWTGQAVIPQASPLHQPEYQYQQAQVPYTQNPHHPQSPQQQQQTQMYFAQMNGYYGPASEYGMR